MSGRKGRILYLTIHLIYYQICCWHIIYPFRSSFPLNVSFFWGWGGNKVKKNLKGSQCFCLCTCMMAKCSVDLRSQSEKIIQVESKMDRNFTDPRGEVELRYQQLSENRHSNINVQISFKSPCQTWTKTSTSRLILLNILLCCNWQKRVLCFIVRAE